MRVPKIGSVSSPAWVLTWTFLFTVLLAVSANLTIEMWQIGGDTEALWDHGVGNNLSLFWLGAFVVWLLVILVLAVVGRLWATVGVVMAVTMVIAFANHEKRELRLEPLFPSDLAMSMRVDFLQQMAGWGTTLTLLGSLILVTGSAVLGGRFAERRFPRVRRRTHPRLALGLILTRGCAVMLTLAGLFYAADFNTPGNRFRAAFEDQGAQWRAWHQNANYTRNGFVAGMLYNTDVPGMSRPAGYNARTMRALAEKYTAAAAAINQRRDPKALHDVNVVLVLSETFSDPTRLETVDLAVDPIPYTRSLMRRTTSGNMLATQFGGGTANMEFAALTGMSLALFQPQMSTPYQMLVPEFERFPSLAGYFAELGHRTVAIHPFLPSLYRRQEAYPVLGFDTATFADQMTNQETLERSPFISDESAFQEVTDQLAATDEPVFANLVTMQNHYPMAGNYANPIPVSGLVDPERTANAEAYARGLRYTDKALRGFIASLDRSQEKTVMLFYGDHLPAFWPAEVRAANGARRLRETPFFVYANFGREQTRRLPTTSPSFFGNHILERADAPVPPYYALLQKMENHVPAMEHLMAIGADDRRIPEGELTARASELLHDYRLVQYDLSVGERYSQSEMFYPVGEPVSAAR